MVDDVKDIPETTENTASAEALDRVRLARERREAEQRKRLDELQAHAASAQAQREKREEDRRRRLAEQRARDDDRRQQVEDRKRAIWEASVSRREALLQRDRDRTERLERARASRSSARSAFAFGSSTPRLLEPVDSAGFYWTARRAASTTNVMFASAPLTRHASALHVNSENDNKDEPDRQQQPVMWSSVARRRTDLMPTVPAPRAPGRAYSMTRLDKIPSQRPLHSASPSMHHLNRTQTRSGETTPGSRPGSAMSTATGVVRRALSAPRKPRPASIAGTGVNTPKGGGDTGSQSVATTPSVSRDGTLAGGDVPRRPLATQRRRRPASLHVATKTAITLSPADGKPPLHRKPKPSKEHDKTPRGKSHSASPGRTLSPSPGTSKEPSVDKEFGIKVTPPTPPPPTPKSLSTTADRNAIVSRDNHARTQQLKARPSPSTSKKPSIDKEVAIKPEVASMADKNQVDVIEITQILEALKMENEDEPVLGHNQNIDHKVNENKDHVDVNIEWKLEQESKEVNQENIPKPAEIQKSVEAPEQNVLKPIEVQKPVEVLKTDESEMNASMTGKRITTEEEAKAALAERRRRAREELEKQAELERQRLQREAEEEAERQRQEDERHRREEEEARELAQLQRNMDEEKLRKAIEAQQQLEREEAERKVREEQERQARLKEEEEKRKAAEEAEKLRKEEAEREERERLVRKQRVEAIMARTRLRKAEEDNKQQDNKGQQNQQNPASSEPPAGAPAPTTAAPAQPDNGNAVATDDLIGFGTSQNEDKAQEQATVTSNNQQQVIDNSANANVLTTETNNGNVQHEPEPTSNVGHISANFIQTERMSAEHNQTKLPENIPKLIEDDFTAHNGHGTTHNHTLTLENAM